MKYSRNCVAIRSPILDGCISMSGVSEIAGLAGGRVLFADGSFAVADIRFDGGLIADIGTGKVPGTLNANGMLVLPGIVDIHGDAFERQLAPRPEAQFPLAMAMADTDRQLLANGITTAFHGITCSWEGGLRGIDTARALVEHIADARTQDLFGADNRVHLRFENHNLEAVEEVIGWLQSGLVDFLAFNDHLPGIARKLDDHGRIARYAERAGVSNARFREILEASRERAGEVPAAVRRLSMAASLRNVPMASHDDTSPEDRRRYQSLGCRIAEFPMGRAAALAARELDNAVIMGAPNVVRGGSHINGVRAADMVGEGICTVLASDYFYPALLVAPFLLATAGIAPLAEAWRLVSRNPARAARLTDRGEIAAGQRADLILVDDSQPAMPRVVATFVRGKARHVSRHLALH